MTNTLTMMNYRDNQCIHQLYERLDTLIADRKRVRQYHKAPDGYSVEEYLQELDEEEVYLRSKIEELDIAQSDYFSEEL